MTVTLATVCSGIGAAECASIDLQITPVFSSEVDRYASAVLSANFPSLPNWGDITAADWAMPYGVDILVGGTPCQSFSVAGKGLSLSDPRGQLTKRFCDIANEYHPRFIVWENVPGVLNRPDNPFGYVIGSLAGSGSAIDHDGKWPDSGVVRGPSRLVAWRVLDAQHFGIPQRRRRVFVVAGDRHRAGWLDAFFEREGHHWGYGQIREAGLGVPGSDAQGDASDVEWWDGSRIARTLCRNMHKKTMDMRRGMCPEVIVDGRLRWLMPHEVERLFGFPDGWTSAISQTQRLKALGNSMAVPVIKSVMRCLIST